MLKGDLFFTLVYCLPPLLLPPPLLRSLVSLMKGKHRQADFLVSFLIPSAPAFALLHVAFKKKRSAGILPKLSASFFVPLLAGNARSFVWFLVMFFYTLISRGSSCNSLGCKESCSAKCPCAEMLLSWPPAHYDSFVSHSVQAWNLNRENMSKLPRNAVPL